MEQWRVNAWNLGKCGVWFGGDLLVEQLGLSESMYILAEIKGGDLASKVVPLLQ